MVLNGSLISEYKNRCLVRLSDTELHGFQKLVKLDSTLQSNHVLKGQACVTLPSIHFVVYVVLHHHHHCYHQHRYCRHHYRHHRCLFRGHVASKEHLTLQLHHTLLTRYVRTS